MLEVPVLRRRKCFEEVVDPDRHAFPRLLGAAHKKCGVGCFGASPAGLEVRNRSAQFVSLQAKNVGFDGRRLHTRGTSRTENQLVTKEAPSKHRPHEKGVQQLDKFCQVPLGREEKGKVPLKG
jgi:hypothetical protein